jgi:glycosyltransferase involved in cell wall biosynthesis
MLLEAIAILQAEGMAVTCRIIGDGPDRAALHEKAQALDIAHAVEFQHDVYEQKEVYALLKAAKVAVFPSAREGFGIAVLEALACGVPVVTTSTPANLAQHLVARSARGIICQPSASALAEAIRPWLADGGSRDVEGAEDWLSEYGWEAITARIAGVLLSEPGGLSESETVST